MTRALQILRGCRQPVFQSLRVRIMSSSTESEAEEAIGQDEMATTTVPDRRLATADSAPQTRTAFTELMAHKPKHSETTTKSSKPLAGLFLGKDGLGAYLKDPAAFPPNRVIYHTDKFVVINDLYPKSVVHTLLLPRDKTKVRLHPFDAFDDREYLAETQAAVQKLVTLVAKELRRKLGRYSAQEREREQAMMRDPPPNELPPGRNWEKEVISGVHAGPSMNHLHVHVLSVDRFSECMKKRNHYNSFATPFLIPLEAFPLGQDDPRRHPGRQGYLRSDLKCWRCGKNFGNKFAKLKEHLAQEFDAWKTE